LFLENYLYNLGCTLGNKSAKKSHRFYLSMRGRYKLYNDAQLAELLIQRDTHAFEEIYNRYFGVIYSFTRKMLGD